MKIFVPVLVGSLLVYTPNSVGQGKMSISLSSVSERGNDVALEFASDKKFIFGGNRYVLHVGVNTFFRSRQSYDYTNHVGQLTFLVPTHDWELLPDSSKLFITYGLPDETTEALEKLSENDFPTSWSMGILEKSKLVK